MTGATKSTNDILKRNWKELNSAYIILFALNKENFFQQHAGISENTFIYFKSSRIHFKSETTSIFTFRQKLIEFLLCPRSTD